MTFYLMDPRFVLPTSPGFAKQFCLLRMNSLNVFVCVSLRCSHPFVNTSVDIPGYQ